MKVVLVDSEVFDELKKRIAYLSEKVAAMSKRNRPKSLSDWLDSSEVCVALNISKKTLQRLRETDNIAYSRFNKKFYYKSEDVQALIKKNR